MRYAIRLILMGGALAGLAAAGGEARILLLERGARTAREIGRIAGAARIAIPEAGGHVLALTGAGEVWAWGANSSGQLGAGHTEPVPGWVRVEGLGKAVAIAAGAEHSVALLEDGTVWTWGGNAMGQLGDGSLLASSRPRAVPGLAGAVSVAAGALLSAVGKGDGSVWVFGSNWGDIAAGHGERLMTRPVRLAGVRVEGEIEVSGARVRKRAAGVVGEIQRENAGVRVVDAAKGWAVVWIEEPARNEAGERVAEEAEKDLGEESRAPAQAAVAGRMQPMAVVTATKVAAGTNHSLALASNGTVWAWGSNWEKQTGGGTGAEQVAPAQVGGIAGATGIAGGRGHSLAVTGDGLVWAWGSNAAGQLGDGTSEPRTGVVQVAGLAGVAAVAAGDMHSLALKTNGTVWAWGTNAYFGRLGDGTTVSRHAPVQVSGLSGVTAISAGPNHSLALKSDGTVWAWGDNSNGMLGDGTTNQSLVPVQVAGLTGVVGVAAGGFHSLAVKNDGTVWAWGLRFYGQVGDGGLMEWTFQKTPVRVMGLTEVSAVAAGEQHSLALRIDGTVWAWGMNATGQLGDGSLADRGTPAEVAGLTGVTGIAAGRDHSLAVRDDGSVRSWGGNRFGQLGDGNGAIWAFPAKVNLPSGMAAVAAGYFHTLAARNDGTVWSWGANEFGQLGDGTLAQRSAPAELPSLSGMSKVAANGYQNLTLKFDGSVWGWGSYNCGVASSGACRTPGLVPGLSGVWAAIGAGQDFSLAAKIDGSVWSWGLGGYRLGYVEEGVRTTPAQINGVSGVTAVAASEGHTLALRSDGTVWSWGWNQYGQLGDGTTTTRVAPGPVSGLKGVVAIAAGPYHSLAVKSDGTLWGWGSNDYGQLGGGMGSAVPAQVAGLSGITAVAVGWMHSLAVRSDGTVWAMGENTSGRLGDGTRGARSGPVQVAGLTGVVAVAAGVDHSLARKSDGTIWSWGDNRQGQLGEPRAAERRTPVVAIPLGSPDLSLTMNHSGNFTAGAQGSYALSVSNVGAAASSGNVRVTVTLPAGVSYVSGAGQGWSCSAQGSTVTCNNGAALAAGASSAITLTVRVGWSSYPGFSVLASVSNAGDLNASNNTAGDPVVVNAPPGYRFKAVTPCRAVDTRWPSGAFGGPFLGANTARSFTLPQSECAIPATVAAYSLNVTVVPRGPLEWLTLWPAGATQPAVSTLNSYAGDVVANAAIVPAGAGGAVSVFVTNPTDVILDVNGYFESTAPSFFYRDTPCRVVDTRWPDGPMGGPAMGGGQTRTFEVPAGGCSIPSSATAYAMNYTVVPAGYLSYLSTWPAGQSQPVVSTLNSWRGKVVANAAIVPAGTGGGVNVFASEATHAILDVNGHFGAGGGAGALSYFPMTPCRLVDTRAAAGAFGGPILGAGSTRGFAAPQGGCGIPATAKAYSVNVTVVPSGPLSWLTAWPTGTAQPVVSTLNSWDGAVVANAAIVPAGTNGAISIFVTDSTHLIVDINGFFQ